MAARQLLPILVSRSSMRSPETKPIDDLSLVEQAAAGDESAFETLVHRYAERVHTLVAGIVRDRSAVEDVVQDVFFKVFRKLSSFAGKSSFYTWLYRVTLNAAADHLKKKRVDRSQPVEDLAFVAAPGPEEAGGQPSDRVELRRRIALAVSELPPKYRDILVLREYQELSYEDIAKVLGCSKGTVESRLFRARARLKAKLEIWLK